MAQTTQGPIYLCQSQTSQDKRYVVEPNACPCEDDYRVNSQKLCKHILARLILEEAINLKEIGKDPLYWQRDGRKAGAHGRCTKTRT